MYYGTGSKSQSKHASLSSGSHTQPIDSAYASMSTGACSSGTSLNRSQGGSQFKANELRVENYLREIPEGLYPRFISMTNKKKKKLVLRRLEQIRWRRSTDSTKFNSDSSGDLSQWSPETDDTENAKGDHHKRKKTGRSGYNLSRLGPKISASSDSFHYKPLFLHQQSPNEQSSMKDGTLSFFSPTKESNADSSGQSGSGAFNRRKLRRYGTIIYYSGTPFCTDLSGDPGDISPTTYMLSGGRERLVPQVQFVRPMPFRSRSGSSMNRRPLSDANLDLGSMSKMDVNDGAGTPEPVTESGDESSEFSIEFPWSDAQQILKVHPLEPCGLGGVLPEDHFRVMVTTRRSKIDAYVNQKCGVQYKLPEEATDNITNRLATMSTSSPRPSVHRLLTIDNSSKIKIEYLSGRTQRLEPVPLPPPAIFFPPLSADSWSEDGFGSDGDDEFTPSEKFLS
ncbi:frequency clock protein [Trichoderma velutinum]